MDTVITGVFIAVLSVSCALIALRVRSLTESLAALSEGFRGHRVSAAREREGMKRDLEGLSVRLRDAEARSRVAESYARRPFGGR